jgi:hypothetical protein
MGIQNVLVNACKEDLGYESPLHVESPTQPFVWPMPLETPMQEIP